MPPEWGVRRSGGLAAGAASLISAGLCWMLIALFACSAAVAGPPFQTDDPDPVAYQHFEMYAFGLSDSTTDLGGLRRNGDQRDKGG
jgi:hypothetical protein